jgi:hypothetical protein
VTVLMTPDTTDYFGKGHGSGFSMEWGPEERRIHAVAEVGKACSMRWSNDFGAVRLRMSGRQRCEMTTPCR